MTRLRLRSWTLVAWAAAKLADWTLVRRAKACGCWACRRAYEPVAVNTGDMRDAILTALGYSTEGRRDRRPS
jgi:hypothetical protein